MHSGTMRTTQGGYTSAGKPKDKGEGAHDGPARVVKPGNRGTAPDSSMKGFHLSAFNMPGRAAAPLEVHELKIAELAREARKNAEIHKRALEKAIKDGENAAQAAKARGREEGLREGERVAAEKFNSALETLQNNTRGVLELLEREKAALFLEFEGQTLELVSSCIHRVFEGLAAGPVDAVLPLLKRAVAAIGEATMVTIKVHPDDFQVVSGNQPFWLPVNASLKDVRVVPDDRITKGGCFVESDATSVGAQAEEMANRIDEELKKVFLTKLQSLQNRMALGTSSTGESVPEVGPDP